MYEAFFLLRSRPFGATAGAGGCWLSPQVGQTVQHAVGSLQNGSEAVLVTGPTGSGKTTICRELAQRMAPRMQPVVLAHCEFGGVGELWRTILFELGLDTTSSSDDEARLSVLRAARALRPQQDGILIVADEADSLSDALLDELRRLTVQRHEGRPVIQLVLSGSFALEERLAKPELSALSHRIGQHILLESLTREQSRQYIAHRVQSAGGAVQEVFTDDALATIIAVCDGNLHCLNQLCDHALLLAFTSDERPVSAATAAAALEDLKGLSLPWNVPATRIVDTEALNAALDVVALHEQRAADSSVAAATDELRLPNVEGADNRQSWWDDAGDAAAIEVGAIQVSMQATLPPPERCSMSSSMNSGSDAQVSDVIETSVVDAYAALDRQGELQHAAANVVPAIPVRSWHPPTPAESTREPERTADKKGESAGVETRLLIDVTALRNEIRASAAAPAPADKPVPAPPARDMAPTEPDWDIVQPEPDAVVLADWPVHAHAAASDSSHDATEPMIDVANLNSDRQRSPIRSSETLPERRYVRLFTRLQQRRAATAAESATWPLRLWR